MALPVPQTGSPVADSAASGHWAFDHASDRLASASSSAHWECARVHSSQHPFAPLVRSLRQARRVHQNHRSARSRPGSSRRSTPLPLARQLVAHHSSRRIWVPRAK